MACNSCHNHSGGMFDEELLRHDSTGTPDIPSSPVKKSNIIWILGGLFVLGTLVVGKKL